MVANGWCASHNAQARRHGQPMHPVGERPKKGRTIGSGGYVKIWAPDHPNAQKSGWVLEHLAVMSASLDRPIWPDENVHHKNGDRTDNRLSNLELWSHRQPKGQRIEDKIAWAIELLKDYQPDTLR